ncbi:unnamed protein product [Polarella glacialis]|uniref:Uncharacterized protein n=1 Tax=Polarella glacialis TaxID=89957 RepID=A0A813LTI4_POLGL|nr:unnamed protein product [Polarella glacialis]CAE8734669.1 unnamed protein product [Polarella glacialis]
MAAGTPLVVPDRRPVTSQAPHDEWSAPQGSHSKRVQYFSSTHGDWIFAKVVATDTRGRLQIDKKPGVWFSADNPKIRLGRPDSHQSAAAQVAPVNGSQLNGGHGVPEAAPFSAGLREVAATIPQQARVLPAQPAATAAPSPSSAQNAAAFSEHPGALVGPDEQTRPRRLLPQDRIITLQPMPVSHSPLTVPAQYIGGISQATSSRSTPSVSGYPTTLGSNVPAAASAILVSCCLSCVRRCWFRFLLKLGLLTAPLPVSSFPVYNVSWLLKSVLLRLLQVQATMKTPIKQMRCVQSSQTHRITKPHGSAQLIRTALLLFLLWSSIS